MRIGADGMAWSRPPIALAAGIALASFTMLFAVTGGVTVAASWVLDLLERNIGITDPVIITVSLISTIYERVVLFLLVGAALGVIMILVRRFIAPIHQLLTLAVAAAFVLFLVYLPFPPLNTETGFTAWGMSALATPALLLGLAYAVLTAVSGVRLLFLPAVVIASLAALIPSGIRLFETTNFYLFHDDAVVRITPRGAFIPDYSGDSRDFNGLALDPVRRRLFADGHGVNAVYAYDLDAPLKAPVMSSEATGGAESLTYNSKDEEIYVFNSFESKLAILDASTLALKKSIPNIALSPGDVLIAWDGLTRRLLLASEADEKTGDSLVILDRDKGTILYSDDVAAGSAVIHPNKSLTYFSFFKHTSLVLAFDMASNTYVADRHVKARLDGMTVDPEAKQVLVASPLQSSILRFDESSLEPAAKISAMFGVRSLAVDHTRGLIICASLVTGMVAVIDQQTHERLAQYRVAPWLRSVALDARTGRAYVSSNYGLYVGDYLKRLPSDVAARNKGLSP
jgi:DNA-binding beta-propeller fold protein YncE